MGTGVYTGLAPTYGWPNWIILCCLTVGLGLVIVGWTIEFNFALRLKTGAFGKRGFTVLPIAAADQNTQRGGEW